MISKGFTEEFKLESIKQIAERHFQSQKHLPRLGDSPHILMPVSKPELVIRVAEDQQAMQGNGRLTV